MKSILLPNDGYVRGSLSEELFDGLLKESLDYENAEFRNTGLKNAYGEQTCPHYELSDKSRIDLMNFLSPYFLGSSWSSISFLACFFHPCYGRLCVWVCVIGPF